MAGAPEAGDSRGFPLLRPPGQRAGLGCRRAAAPSAALEAHWALAAQELQERGASERILYALVPRPCMGPVVGFTRGLRARVFIRASRVRSPKFSHELAN